MGPGRRLIFARIFLALDVWLNKLRLMFSKRVKVYSHVLILILFIAGCRSAPQLTFDKTDTRFKNQAYFHEEFKLIKKRRKNLPVKRSTSLGGPDNLLGLALSGGGIRSNAFQLGLLSGLHKSKLLSFVDYISAASGGSWAAASYKTYRKSDSSFFKNVETYVDSGKCSLQKKHGSRFNCFLHHTYKRTIALRNMLDLKGAWRKMIKRQFIAKGGDKSDMHLSDLEKKSKRPVLIVNGAHRAGNLILVPGSLHAGAKRTFPFQFSGLHLGTVADCGNVPGNGNYKQNKSCVGLGKLAKGNMKGVFTPAADKQTQVDGKKGGFSLSQALAVSSGFFHGLRLPVFGRLNVFTWNVTLPGKKKPYPLSDGGHSENTGALALVERRTRLIVVSDAGEDRKYNFKDQKVTAYHMRKLLNVDFKLLPGQKKGSLYRGTYTGRDQKKPVQGYVLYVKPRNTPGFRRWLKQRFEKRPSVFSKRILKIVEQGINGPLNFPMTSTGKLNYSQELVMAYYLLGRYIAEERVSRPVQKFIKENRLP